MVFCNNLQLNALKEANFIFNMSEPVLYDEALIYLNEFNRKIDIAVTSQINLNLLIFELYNDKLRIVQDVINLQNDFIALNNRLDEIPIALDNNLSIGSIDNDFNLN